MRRLRRFLHENGLSIALGAVFALSLIGQVAGGLLAYDAQRAEHGQPPVGVWRYLTTGHFLDAVFCNWQAAILQLGVLIVFTRVLRQRGASHSRHPESGDESDAEPEQERHSWLYRNSLSLAFAAMFVLSFAGHVVCAPMAHNENAALTGERPTGTFEFLLHGKFWYLTLQAWQAEFVAIFLFVLLSIWLRQEGSAESKPVHSPHGQTGGPNE